jgi:hypothetical protein
MLFKSWLIFSNAIMITWKMMSPTLTSIGIFFIGIKGFKPAILGLRLNSLVSRKFYKQGLIKYYQKFKIQWGYFLNSEGLIK